MASRIEYLETDGGQLAIELEGAPDAPLIICAPAMGVTRDTYGPLATQLVAAGFRVARVDARGHGDSSTGFARYGDDAMADDFLALIRSDAVGRGRPAVLVGASFSAGAATIAAGREPSLVAGLVLLAPFLRSPVGRFVGQAFQIVLWRPWGPAVWRYYAATLWPGLGVDGARTRAASTTKSLTHARRWSAFQRTIAGADHDRCVTPWLEKARNTPALVVLGDKDPDWSEPLTEARWVASNFSSAETLTVAGAGHAPELEKPEVVGPAILILLEKIGFGRV